MKRIFSLLLLFTLASCSNEKYRVIKNESNVGVCRFQVELKEELEEEELRGIAEELKSDYEGCNKLWISFYLPNLPPDENGNGAWAVASFNPDFEMNILGGKVAAGLEEKNISFPKYLSVEEMINANGDYKDNCFEDLSIDNNNHVRISSEFLETENIVAVKEQTKRDIVYVVFQTFAQTDLKDITVTAIPIIRTTFNPNIKYDGEMKEELKLTVTVTREKAKGVLKKYLKTDSFKDLYVLDGTLYLPSSKFERLKGEELERVFLDLN